MNLWIRSQDQQVLKKADNLDIYTVYGRGIDEHDYYVIEESGTDVGEYETKERAIKVLDEIHQRLIDMQSLEIIGDIAPNMMKRELDCVYQMPEE